VVGRELGDRVVAGTGVLLQAVGLSRGMRAFGARRAAATV
jgi:hypothetical protein